MALVAGGSAGLDKVSLLANRSVYQSTADETAGEQCELG